MILSEWRISSKNFIKFPMYSTSVWFSFETLFFYSIFQCTLKEFGSVAFRFESTWKRCFFSPGHLRRFFRNIRSMNVRTYFSLSLVCARTLCFCVLVHSSHSYFLYLYIWLHTRSLYCGNVSKISRFMKRLSSSFVPKSRIFPSSTDRMVFEPFADEISVFINKKYINRPV